MTESRLSRLRSGVVSLAMGADAGRTGECGPTTVRTANSIMSERIPPPPPTQALNSTTFVPPPLDLSLTTAELIDFHRTHSPNHVAWVYEDVPGEHKQITLSTWARAIHRAARYARNLFQLPEPQLGGVKPIISLLANSGKKNIRLPPSILPH